VYLDKPGRIDVTVRLAGLVDKQLKCYKESTIIINVAPKAHNPNIGCPTGFKLVNGICQEQSINCEKGLLHFRENKQ
jgi:hypothetical protein